MQVGHDVNEAGNSAARPRQLLMLSHLAEVTRAF